MVSNPDGHEAAGWLPLVVLKLTHSQKPVFGSRVCITGRQQQIKDANICTPVKTAIRLRASSKES